MKEGKDNQDGWLSARDEQFGLGELVKVTNRIAAFRESSSVAPFLRKGASAEFTGRWMCAVAKDVRLLLEEQLSDTLGP